MSERMAKTISIAIFISLSGSLIIAFQAPPARGYELSVYDSLPVAFWILLTVSLGLSILVLLYPVLFGNKDSRLWMFGFLGMVMGYSIFLILPVLRGYFLGFGNGWDALTQIGEMKAISLTGEIGNENFYPTLHILGSSLTLLMSISPAAVGAAMPVIFLVFYFSSIYLFGVSVGRGRATGLILVAFASPLLFSFIHRSLHPAFLSLYAVPLLFYLWHKRSDSSRNRTSITIAMLLVAFFITFSHPITALIVIVIFAIIILFVKYFGISFMPQNASIAPSPTIEPPSMSMVLILATMFFAWYFSYASILESLKKVVDWLIYQETAALAEFQFESLLALNPTFGQAARIFINMYGAIFIYLTLSFVLSILVLKSYFRGRDATRPIELLYSLLFLTAISISLTFAFGYFIEFDLLRILRFPLLFSVLFNGLIFSRVIRQDTSNARRSAGRMKARNIRIIVLTFMVIAAVIISIFNTYGSPRTLRANEAITNMEATGMRWFLSHGNYELTTVSNIAVHRFEDLFVCLDRSPCVRMTVDPNAVPPHFGYDGNSSMAEVFQFGNGYLITTELDRLTLLVFPKDLRDRKVHVYLEEDFKRLRNDWTLILLYSNGELEVWGVNW